MPDPQPHPPGRGIDVAALSAAAYEDLRVLAKARLRSSAPLTLLDTTDLVSETYKRLALQYNLQIESRAHFLGYCSRVMRSVGSSPCTTTPTGPSSSRDTASSSTGSTAATCGILATFRAIIGSGIARELGAAAWLAFRFRAPGDGVEVVGMAAELGDLLRRSGGWCCPCSRPPDAFRRG